MILEMLICYCRDSLCNTISKLIKPSKIVEFLLIGSFDLELV